MTAGRKRPGTLFWVETVLAAVTAVLFVVTLLWHDWIEAFGIEPDAGDGTAEWLILGVLLASTLALVMAAGREWRRTQPAPA
jgi:hypothetical protein